MSAYYVFTQAIAELAEPAHALTLWAATPQVVVVHVA